MIINVILPSSIHTRDQIKKSIFRSQFMKAIGNNESKVGINDRSNIVFKGNSIIMSFDSNDTAEVQRLRRITANLCKGSIVGVDRKNPITTGLPGVKEVIFEGG